jgi:hypothetical protein
MEGRKLKFGEGTYTYRSVEYISAIKVIVLYSQASIVFSYRLSVEIRFRYRENVDSCTSLQLSPTVSIEKFCIV